jgi:hypothetical protein
MTPAEMMFPAKIIKNNIFTKLFLCGGCGPFTPNKNFSSKKLRNYVSCKKKQKKIFSNFFCIQGGLDPLTPKIFFSHFTLILDVSCKNKSKKIFFIFWGREPLDPLTPLTPTILFFLHHPV